MLYEAREIMSVSFFAMQKQLTKLLQVSHARRNRCAALDPVAFGRKPPAGTWQASREERENCLLMPAGLAEMKSAKIDTKLPSMQEGVQGLYCEISAHSNAYQVSRQFSLLPIQCLPK